MTNQTPSTEDVRHHLVEIEPSDSICRECSTFDGHVYTDTVEWPCPVETRDREAAAKAVRDAADRAEEIIISGDIAETAACPDCSTGVMQAIDARDALQDDPVTWLNTYAASIGAGHE